MSISDHQAPCGGYASDNCFVAALIIVVCALPFMSFSICLMQPVFIPSCISVLPQLLLPLAMLLTAACIGEGGGKYPGIDDKEWTSLWRGLRWSGLFALGLAPFLLWQFRLYDNWYMLFCGLICAIAAVIYLTLLLRLESLVFNSLQCPISSLLCRWTSILLPPLTATMTGMTYLFSFRYGGEWVMTPMASPYSVWLRLPQWMRLLPAASLVLILALSVNAIITVKLKKPCRRSASVRK